MRVFPLILLALCALPAAAQTPANLLRNGSFEGGKRYWYEADDKALVRGKAADGEYCLSVPKGGLQSAAFLLQPGKAVTLSFSARADGPATMGWQCTPCSREVGTKAGQTWGMRGAHPVPLGSVWKRYSFQFTPTAPQDGFWPRPTYMLQLGDADKPFQIDAVTVAYGAGAEGYVPRRPVEAQVDCPDLPGYKDPSGNTFGHGATVRLLGSAANPGQTPRSVTLRWQLYDYEGRRPVGKAVEQTAILTPYATVQRTVFLRLGATGMVLARFSVLAGGQTLDSSDLPLTSLPYPVHATRPDYRERFGSSFAGWTHCIDVLSRLGYAWSRWSPHTEWQDHQPDGPDSWRWYDKELDTLAAHGMSMHLTLYGRPAWAFSPESSPLPKDMLWSAADPRWDDLHPQCAWDRFIAATVAHYKGRSLIYEIENEPNFDGWDGKEDLYVHFTTRTARLIKQTDPHAQVMVNNVYAIPDGLNGRLLASGAGKWIDVVSWHDYHEGWLADATAIKRMHQNLVNLGCPNVQIWFNEGWAYTNTAVDEPAVALTNLDSAQSTNAMVDSVAELTANGQEKTILFHTAYDDHGQSFWDYAGPGQMLWDYYGYPLPLAAAWNTLAHHIGLSRAVGFIRPVGANFCIFDDLRNGRGVCIAYADRDSKSDVTVTLPLRGVIAEDCMGNVAPLAGKNLTLSKTGRPVFLYTTSRAPGRAWLQALTSLDRRHEKFVSGAAYRLPRTWEGTRVGSADSNPILSGGRPVWRLDQVWPDDPTIAANYTPLIWNGTEWHSEKNDMGGQPALSVRDGGLDTAARGSWGSPGQGIGGLVFLAPKSGVYHVTGTARTHPWAGGAKSYRLGVYQKDTQRATPVKTFDLPRGGDPVPMDFTVELTAGHELVFLPLMPDWNNATHTTLQDLTIRMVH